MLQATTILYTVNVLGSKHGIWHMDAYGLWSSHHHEWDSVQWVNLNLQHENGTIFPKKTLGI